MILKKNHQQKENAMSKKILSQIELSSLAGKARAKSLTQERRKEIAKKAGMAKGTKGLPKASHGGTLKLGDKEIECGVLPGGIRVISLASIQNALGLSKPGPEMRRKSEVTKSPTFFASDAINPYYLDVFKGCFSFIEFVNKFGSKTIGVEATLLPKICEVYLKARDAGVLTKPQIPIAITADIIMRSLAQIGVIALVDEVSGYQEERAKNELQQLLEKYISEELRAWTQKFPNEFFKQIYRLHNWTWPKVNKNHPQYVGQLINKYVYDRLPPGVKEELQKKNPINESGCRTHRHHQFLTEDVGDDNLQKQITQVVTLMRVSDDMDEFKKLIEKV